MTWEPLNLTHGIPTKWLWVVWYPEHFHCGERVDIGAFTYIQAVHGVTIEDDVQIGSHCSLYSASTIDQKIGPITIGRGACIGTHSTIMPNITIGAGAVIGAHSFVNRDVAPGEVAYGVPIRGQQC